MDRGLFRSDVSWNSSLSSSLVVMAVATARTGT
jgi:hypothetical protein